MNNLFWILGQLLILISYLIFWISRFMKEKNNILILDNVSRIFAIIGFLFLKTYDGIKNTLYVILRNLLGQFTNEKSKRNKSIVFCIMFLTLILIYSFDFNGISTICIAICGILNLYGVIMCNEQGIRICGMFGSFFYMSFMFFTYNITGLVCEVICFLVMLVSYFKYKKLETNKGK